MIAENVPIKPVRLVLGLIACLGLVSLFFTLLFGFTTIPANSVGVKTRFGAYHDIVNPGLAYAIPYIDEIHIVPTQRLLKLEFGFTSPNATNIYQGDMEPEQTETMITGDLNTALVPWVVQYRITDPKMYLFGAREPEKTLRDLSESVMREVVGDRTVDEVLTIGRHDIETSTLKRLADLCSQYGLGLQIQQVQLATVRPPPAVQAAFNEVRTILGQADPVRVAEEIRGVQQKDVQGVAVDPFAAVQQPAQGNEIGRNGYAAGIFDRI